MFLIVCERLLESYTFLELSLYDILNSITLASLKIIHRAIITPRDLINSLQEISEALRKDNLNIHLSNVAKYFEMIELSIFQSEPKYFLYL